MVPRASGGGAADRAYPLWRSEFRATTVAVMELMMISNAALFYFFVLRFVVVFTAGWPGVPPASSMTYQARRIPGGFV